MYQNEFPKMNYVVILEAKRIKGSDFFCGLTFPFNDEFATLIVGGWGGTVVGLSSIGGLDASENETARMKKFEKERQNWKKQRKRRKLPIKPKLIFSPM